LRYFVLIHTLGVAIDEEYLMLGRRQGLEEKHPKMRHEIAGYTIIGVEKQDSHEVLSYSRVNNDPVMCPWNITHGRRCFG
jgi:hypothetical protein